ncbi:hypothetical protein LCGC14_3064330, partial [marine sediment metagenome]
ELARVNAERRERIKTLLLEKIEDLITEIVDRDGVTYEEAFSRIQEALAELAKPR